MDALKQILIFAAIAFALIGFGIPLFWRLLGRNMGKSSYPLLLVAFAIALFVMLSLGEEMGVAAGPRLALTLVAVLIGGVNWARSRFGKA